MRYLAVFEDGGHHACNLGFAGNTEQRRIHHVTALFGGMQQQPVEPGAYSAVECVMAAEYHSVLLFESGPYDVEGLIGIGLVADCGGAVIEMYLYWGAAFGEAVDAVHVNAVGGHGVDHKVAYGIGSGIRGHKCFRSGIGGLCGSACNSATYTGFTGSAVAVDNHVPRQLSHKEYFTHRRRLFGRLLRGILRGGAWHSPVL